MAHRWKCSECVEYVELIAPDKTYYIPKKEPTSQDYIKKIHDCTRGHHNTVFWHKEPTIMASVGKNGVDVMES